MLLRFPDQFIWGTSTAAAQIETPFEHEWKGVKSRDGYVFNRTCDHELRRDEDIEYITALGNAYRMGFDWSRLQKAPLAPFDKAVVEEYRDFMKKLKARGTYLMLVIHHFSNPIWFAKEGGWENAKTIDYFIDFTRQIIQYFGDLADNWNTFNEPGVYITNAYVLGNFPPQKKSYITARKVLKNMAKAHVKAVRLLKIAYPDIPVGISKNCVIFKSEHPLGYLPARFADHFFMNTVADHFVIPELDYFGMSYYAKIPFIPQPITEIDNPGKLAEMGRAHDMMWEYYPQGMEECMMRYWKKYKKPMMITESGISTNDCDVRIAGIKDYLKHIHNCIQNGVEVLGYFHWSTMDNFEWNLGPTYRFGLVHVDFETCERTMKRSGAFYQQVIAQNGVEV